MSLLVLLGLGLLALVIFVGLTSLRKVVPTNQVHIVQSSKSSIAYGTGYKSGNVYYQFPSYLPILGISVSKFSTAVFDLTLSNYEAYDKDRVPFVVDITAFFRVSDPVIASNRISSMDDLRCQLKTIIQGSARSILAKEDLESIMCERTKYGQLFTDEVSEQLKEWGVETVKNIELMDVRDSQGNSNIENIMKKKESEIAMESRVTVAENMKKAQEAEIFANQEVAIKEQESRQQIGLKEATVSQQVGIAEEKSKQLVQEQAKVTAEKEMEVLKVREVQQAEIQKTASIVKAEQDKEVTVLNAEASKQEQELRADANLAVATKGAEGIKVQGIAKADAEKALQLASVEAQTKLAKEIGGNKEYQTYLITIEQIKASQEVGIEQAKNLGKADIKIFANGASVSEGVTQAQGMLSPKTGLNIGSMIETLGSTEGGKQLIDSVSTLLTKSNAKE